MPRKTITSEQLAIARALEGAGYSTHHIAEILQIDRSGLNYNLSGQRKSDTPSILDGDILSALTSSLCHARMVGRRAVADALRRAADDLDAQADAQDAALAKK